MQICDGCFSSILTLFLTVTCLTSVNSELPKWNGAYVRDEDYPEQDIFLSGQSDSDYQDFSKLFSSNEELNSNKEINGIDTDFYISLDKEEEKWENSKERPWMKGIFKNSKVINEDKLKKLEPNFETEDNHKSDRNVINIKRNIRGNHFGKLDIINNDNELHSSLAAEYTEKMDQMPIEPGVKRTSKFIAQKISKINNANNNVPITNRQSKRKFSSHKIENNQEKNDYLNTQDFTSDLIKNGNNQQYEQDNIKASFLTNSGDKLNEVIKVRTNDSLGSNKISKCKLQPSPQSEAVGDNVIHSRNSDIKPLSVYSNNHKNQLRTSDMKHSESFVQEDNRETDRIQALNDLSIQIISSTKVYHNEEPLNSKAINKLDSQISIKNGSSKVEPHITNPNSISNLVQDIKNTQKTKFISLPPMSYPIPVLNSLDNSSSQSDIFAKPPIKDVVENVKKSINIQPIAEKHDRLDTNNIFKSDITHSQLDNRVSIPKIISKPPDITYTNNNTKNMTDKLGYRSAASVEQHSLLHNSSHVLLKKSADVTNQNYSVDYLDLTDYDSPLLHDVDYYNSGKSINIPQDKSLAMPPKAISKRYKPGIRKNNMKYYTNNFISSPKRNIQYLKKDIGKVNIEQTDLNSQERGYNDYYGSYGGADYVQEQKRHQPFSGRVTESDKQSEGDDLFEHPLTLNDPELEIIQEPRKGAKSINQKKTWRKRKKIKEGDFK